VGARDDESWTGRSMTRGFPGSAGWSCCSTFETGFDVGGGLDAASLSSDSVVYSSSSSSFSTSSSEDASGNLPVNPKALSCACNSFCN